MRRFVVICLIVASLITQRIPTSLQAQPDAPPVPVAPVGTHPRLLITTTYLDQMVRPRQESNSAAWQTFKTYADSETVLADIHRYPESALKSLALAWLLTGETLYREQAIRGIQRVVNQIEDTLSQSDESGNWDRDFLDNVAALAIAYDWLYDVFSSDDRAILMDTLLRAADYLLDPTAGAENVWIADTALSANAADESYSFQTFDSASVAWLWALTATALALRGDTLQADNLSQTARDLWEQQILPALALQPNGAWAAGPFDGFRAGWALTKLALTWWIARGENDFAATDWWYDRMAYNVLLHFPAVQTIGQEAFLGYPAIIGDGYRNHPDASLSRAQNMVLRTLYPDTPHAAWVDWILNQPPGIAPDWLLVEELLWRDPAAGGNPPEILTWRSFGTNHIFMRSNWQTTEGGLDPDATHVTFYAGDYFAPRQFFDQGNFTIWHGGSSLVTRGGVYTGRGDSWHEANYYGRTIGGNTLLVCNLAEIFDEIRPLNDQPAGVWLNDCGQRATGLGIAGAINPGYWEANRIAFETGNFVRLFDSPGITYMQTNLTTAYNSVFYTTQGNTAKVESVIRELVYIRPGTVLIHDRLVTLGPEFTTISSLHFDQRPRFDGLRWIVENGEAALYLQNLGPTPQSEIVEGYITSGQDTAIAAGRPLEPGPGWFRLDTYAQGGTATPWFLTGLIAQDRTAPPPAVATFATGNSMRGAVISTPEITWQVMFDDDPNDVSAATFMIEPDVQSLLITGLAAETPYRLMWADGRMETLTTHGAGTLVVSAPVPGSLTLEIGG
ncbi:MAG: hypothetical protein GYB66_02700 [Chloroflexi bacterium]|nr:hypothetical protein [Chloroflexota bacterium]